MNYVLNLTNKLMFTLLLVSITFIAVDFYFDIPFGVDAVETYDMWFGI